MLAFGHGFERSLDQRIRVGHQSSVAPSQTSCAKRKDPMRCAKTTTSGLSLAQPQKIPVGSRSTSASSSSTLADAGARSYLRNFKCWSRQYNDHNPVTFA